MIFDPFLQLSRFQNLKQRSDESLSEYSKRLFQELDSFKSLSGRKIFNSACEKLEDYATTADQDKFKKDAFDAFTSILFMKNSDQRKYGSLLQSLKSDFSLGTDKYPKTKEKTLDALSNHPFDQKFVDAKKKNREHKGENAPNMIHDEILSNFAQGPKEHLICHYCGKKGHAAPACTLREKIARENWYIHKISAKSQSKHNGDDKKQGPSVGKKAWSGFQHQIHHCHAVTDTEGTFRTDLENVIILDTGSTIGATFMKKNLLSDIKTTSSPLKMVTNTGTKKIFQVGVVNGFGEAWYDPDQVANIFGFAKLEDQCRITYDSSIEKAFNVHTDDGIVKFKRNKDGLYVYRPSKNYLKGVAGDTEHGDDEPNRGENFLVDSIKENKQGFTARQFEDAKQARKLYHILGCPTASSLFFDKT
jgi:hypothetical protein